MYTHRERERESTSPPPRETYTEKRVYFILREIYIRIDVLTLQIDTLVDVGRRFVCWFSVNRQPGRDWQLCIRKLEGKEKNKINCYYLFFLVLNINDHLSSLKWMLTAQNVWLLWYDWGDQTKSSQTHTLYANFGLFSGLSFLLSFMILHDAIVSPTLWPVYSLDRYFIEQNFCRMREGGGERHQDS